MQHVGESRVRILPFASRGQVGVPSTVVVVTTSESAKDAFVTKVAEKGGNSW